MADAASDGSDSENDLNEIFGESSDEDDFGGFVFELPDDIEWEKDPNGAAFRTYYEENPRVVFQRTHCGPTVDRLPGNGKTIDIFSLFLSDEFLNKIARWTNRWFEVKKAAEPTKHQTPFTPITDVRELKAYFALLLAMNRDVILPRYENYFRQDERKWLFLVPGFNCVLTQQRFQQLNRYVFFANPDDLDLDSLDRVAKDDKLIKVRPFLEELQKAFKANFKCGKAISIHECMIPYKGKLSFKQRMIAKPIHWGIKLYELCDSETAYLSRFEVYLGKGREGQEVSDIGKAGAVVARLTQDFGGQGYHLYIDNWYNSVALCMYLQERDMFVCGTVRANRKGYPKELNELKASKMGPRGSREIRSYSGIAALAWKDNKLVHFLSTIHSPDQMSTIQRNQRLRTGGYQLVDVPAHVIIDDYNANMGGVDRNDQMTSIFKSRKQMRWYMRLVLKLLEAAAFNAYIIEGFFVDHNPSGQRKRDLAAFREELILQLVGSWRREKAKPGRKRQSEPFRLDNVGEHLPVKGAGCDHTCQVCIEKRRRYIACHPDTPKHQVPYKMTKTTFKCSCCDVYLCMTREQNCFKAWHTKAEYWK